MLVCVRDSRQSERGGVPRAGELTVEYCAQEPEDRNREQELPEDFEDDKFSLIL
jgi:hypothetical protein